jgi:predicted PurR-regulated permease PerM
MADTPRDFMAPLLAVICVFTLIFTSIWILRPFLGSLVWAATIVIATWPLMLTVQRWLWGKRSLAVMVMTGILLCLLIVPLLLAVGKIVGNVDEIISWSKSLADFKLPPVPAALANLPLVGATLASAWQQIAAGGVEDFATKAAPYAAGMIRWFVAQIGNVGVLIVEFLLTVILAAALFAKGEDAGEYFLRFGRRVGGAHGEMAILLAAQTVRGVALGVVGTALAQALLGGIGLVVAGVPFAPALTALMFILCVAQIGPILVLAPAVGWLYWSGATAWGTFLLVCLLIVVSMDNVLRPLLIKRGADLPLLIIFAGVIGGLFALGLLGIFVGPVVLAVGYTLLGAWLDEEKPIPSAGR